LAALPLLPVIIGPTGSGKTALSLQLATRFHGEIVNCDSVAMYREFRIGTAKPAPEEQAMAPHHLLNVIEPTEFSTAGAYARMARAVIQEINSRGAMPIVVGGTGLYLRALVEGLFPGPERSEELRERLRARAAETGPSYLQQILARLDPAAADKIHAHDAPKLVRAIEVSLAARRPMSEQWQQGRDALQGYRVLRIGLSPERNQLYRRINSRVQRMFDQGLIEETSQLRKKYGDSARPLASIGYRQVVLHLQGRMDLGAAIPAVQQAHRNYAKRQMTWFRREPGVHWIAGFGNEPEVADEAARLVAGALSQP